MPSALNKGRPAPPCAGPRPPGAGELHCGIACRHPLGAYPAAAFYQGGGTGKSGLSILFKRIMAAAGIDPGVARERTGAAGRRVSGFSFHSLRHSFVSALVARDAPAEIRQQLTGHSDGGHASKIHPPGIG